jgi:hypothetical protein
VKVHHIRQQFARPNVEDVEGTVREQLAKVRDQFAAGDSIAIAVGSRGIANIARVVRTLVQYLSDRGVKPFIIPAMGSHGGATAEGQEGVLESYGITASAMGCPVRSSKEVTELESAGLANPLFMDRFAFGADGIVLVNRIKPHTDFHGKYESGLVKMAVIGLGKEKQAHAMHCFGIHGLRDLIPLSAERIFATGKVRAGIAMVENAYDETAVIEAMPESEIMEREPELLAIARENMPRLPVDALDVLVIERLGKNISGSGIDTNIIGRIRIDGEPEPKKPRIRSILVTDLTDETHGNATGIGLADVVSRRLADKIDFKTTYTNIITSGFLERGKLPVVAESDEQGFEIAMRGAGCREANEGRFIAIRDTLHLSEMFVSKSVLAEISSGPDIEMVGEPVELFEAGKLAVFKGVS